MCATNLRNKSTTFSIHNISLHNRMNHVHLQAYIFLNLIYISISDRKILFVINFPETLRFKQKIPRQFGCRLEVVNWPCRLCDWLVVTWAELEEGVIWLLIGWLSVHSCHNLVHPIEGDKVLEASVSSAAMKEKYRRLCLFSLMYLKGNT